MNQANDFYGHSEPIAVIGMAGRFPGAPDIEAFWRSLVEGRSVSRAYTAAELDAAEVSVATRGEPDFVGAGAFLEGCEQFDAALFGYSRAEAEMMDPQQRLFLQAAWRALESAGYAPLAVPHKTGVFGSARMSSYPSLGGARFGELAQARGMQALMGNDKDYLCTRVAYKLRLTGPALTVQTACSSSLVAVHMACESLRAGDCDMALAGGVGLSFPQCGGYRHQPGMIFSPDAQCRPFDAGANGTFAGQGQGLVVLRRLQDAERDGDTPIAILRGSAVNNDGHRKVGYTAPSVAGQAEVISEALLLADVQAGDVGLIEAHGTGTPLGDPIEVEALRSVFPQRAAGEDGCAIGSLKGNFGHLDTAAGIAGLLKAILAVNRGVIPATLNCAIPNPALQLGASPFYVPTQRRAWRSAVRTAGVSSFGIGGTNCHVVVQSAAAQSPRAQPLQQCAQADADAPAMLLLSAASSASLRALASAYAGACLEADPRALARSALRGRQLDLAYRLATPATAEMGAALAAYAAGEDDVLVYRGEAGKRGKLAWVFTGQGAQWPGMGREMARHCPVFAEMLDRCDRACRQPLPLSLKDLMFHGDAALLERPEYAQPATVAFELAMAAHWRSLGLAPDVVIGHSWGEFAASSVAGAYGVEQIMALAVESGRLLQLCPEGRMISVSATPEIGDAVAATHGLEPAARNGAAHTVYAGLPADVEAFAAAMQARGIRCRRLASVCAAHSSLLDAVVPGFAAHCAAIKPAPLHTPLVSTLDGAWAPAGALLASDHWPRQMRGEARYAEALQCLREAGVTACLELGSSAILADMGARETAGDFHWMASHRPDAPVAEVLHDACARLYTLGHEMDWKAIFATPGPRVPLPLYVFDTQAYWFAAATSEPAAGPASDALAMASGRVAAGAGLADVDLDHMDAFYDCVAELHTLYVDRMLETVLGRALDQAASAAEIMSAGRLLPRYRQLLQRLLDACVEDGDYAVEGERYVRARHIPHERLPALLQTLLGQCEGHDAIAHTIARAGENLAAILRGEVDAVAVIFPAGQTDGVEVLYRDFSFGRYFNRVAAGVLAGLRQAHEASPAAGTGWRILEVGGGTGGTTHSLLPELRGCANVRYDFTDISPIFTRRAQAKFADFPFLRCSELDLQLPVADQGYAPASYDLIVAANVIHATPHIGRTLANLRTLLKPGGKLLMREITRTVRLFDFVFGGLVLPLQDAEARLGKLFLSVQGWREHCMAAGFEQLRWLPDEMAQTSRMCEHVILATLPAGASDAGAVVSAAAAPDGAAVFDWSGCAGDAGALAQALDRACHEMAQARNQGGGVPQCVGSVPTAPSWLGEVRAAWNAGLLGRADIDFHMRDPQGAWIALAHARTQGAPGHDAALPYPLPAADTHYAPVWEPLAVARLRATVPRAGLSPALVHALAQAGVADGPGCRIVSLHADTPLALAQAAMKALAAWPGQDLLFVTRQAWAVEPGKAVNATQRALWGLLCVAANESAMRRIAMADLAQDAPWSDLMPALAAIGSGPWGIAVRHGAAYALRWHVVQGVSPRIPAGALDTSRWQVVTGGFGGLGRVALRWLARSGARRIAVLAPRLPDDFADLNQVIERSGRCELRWIACDCGDAEQLAACLARLASDGGIDGAIHAAGVLDDAPLAILDATRIGRVLAIKAGGAAILRDGLRAAGARYLLLYSSAAAALGPPGQAAHAMACAYLDGLAAECASADAPLRVMSIAWGAWSEVGRAASDENLQRLAQQGMSALRPAEGLWHLEQALMDGAPYRLAMRVDAQRLAAPVSISSSVPPPEAAGTDDVAGWLAGEISRQLRLDAGTRIDPAQDLMQLGLDSLMFLDLGATIAKAFGVVLDTNIAYEDMTLDALAALIALSLPRAACAGLAGTPVHDAANRYEPFALTPIQHAYWLGRTDLVRYGGVACHVVFEWDQPYAELAPARLELAWNALVARHDMLRMVVSPDGAQRILEQVPPYRFAMHDLRQASATEREAHLLRLRGELACRVLPTDAWPLFEIAITHLDTQRYRLHMNLDLLQFDTQSFKVMMDDWADAYRGEISAPLSFTFRDYVGIEQARRESREWKESLCYWQDGLAALPPAPVLPMLDQQGAGQAEAPPRHSACQHVLDASSWAVLKADWKQRGITPSAALLTLFGWTLATWARHPAFTLNLTYFDRRPHHPDVSRLIGDFTSVLLVGLRREAGESLHGAMQRTQRELWRHVGHAQINGVEVLREWSRQQGAGGLALMPVVFTSMLGMMLDGVPADDALGGFLGEPVYRYTQTPQVWLDHQIMEKDGALVLNWFCREGVFADDIHLAMFRDYVALVCAVAGQPAMLEWPESEVMALMPAHAVGPLHAWRTALGPAADQALAVERALRLHPAVGAAQVEVMQGGMAQAGTEQITTAGPRLVATVVASDTTPPSHAASAHYDCALPAPDARTLELVEASWRHLEARARRGIAGTLAHHGLFIDTTAAASLDTVSQRLGALAKYRRLLRQWLNLLCDSGVLRRDGLDYLAVTPLDAAFPDVPDAPDAPWSRILSGYLDNCVAQHADLLQGRLSPLAMLFEGGVARSLYGEHPALASLNRRAAILACGLARHLGRPLDVLELGAGTAATTRVVVPALKEQLGCYTFTDISPLFLLDARGLLGDHSALRYMLLDINQPLDIPAHPEQGYDLVIASNVLHDATHVERALRRIRRLLKPGGRLMLMEATTRVSAMQLASVGFLEGLSAYRDSRILDDKTMLDLPMWRVALASAGYVIEQQWPGADDSALRQHLLTARAVGATKLDLASLRRGVLETLGDSVAGLALREAEMLPMPAQPAGAGEKTTEAKSAETRQSGAIEADVARLWEALLEKPVTVLSDFFQSGGDSLIATRMIARLNRMGYAGASLQALFAQPVLGVFCRALSAPDGALAGDALLLLKDGDASRTRYVLPAADGGTTAYLALAGHLDGRVLGLQALALEGVASMEALAQRLAAQIHARHAAGPCELIGWSYGAHLAVAVGHALRELGHAPRLVLLDPVNRLDAALARRDAAGLPAHVERLLGYLHDAPAPLLHGMPCLWIEAAGRPPKWTRPETEWLDLAAKARHRLLPGSHWDIVTSVQGARATADAILHWDSEHGRAS
jgi:yersiniabactin nonribosomal peptide/polyketide synthase